MAAVMTGSQAMARACTARGTTAIRQQSRRIGHSRQLGYHNAGVGLLLDTNKDNFIVEEYVIENNAGEDFMHETSYTFHRENVRHDNSSVGPWTFVAYETGSGFDVGRWQSKPYLQDAGSSFADTSAPRC
jgi:hypothetical protein